ncbi:hypothetical protein CSW98_05320 [Vibrio sp. HA2012]|nr:hypothetical protein CSW98_05320 [Vibrio sp. HA2012]
MLVAFVLSGISVGAPLMPDQVSVSEFSMSAAEHSGGITCASSQEHSIATEIDCCNDDVPVTSHQCCPVSCATGLLMSSQTVSLVHQTSTLILIPRDTVKHANSVASTLYRPPII